MESVDESLARLSRLIHDGTICGHEANQIFARIFSKTSKLLERCLSKTECVRPPRRTEQSLLILFITMFGTVGVDKIAVDKGAQLVCDLLSSIKSDWMAWSDAFVTGFVKVVFSEMIKFDQARKSQQVGTILVDLLGQITAVICQSDDTVDYIFATIANVLLDVVGECNEVNAWMDELHVDRVLIASQTLISFIHEKAKEDGKILPEILVTMTSAALRACYRVTLLMNSSIGSSQPPTTRAPKEAVKDLVEMSLEILDAGLSDTSVMRDVIILLATCARIDPAHVSIAIQAGIKFFNRLPSLIATRATGEAPMASNEKETTKLEMAAFAHAMRALQLCTLNDDAAKKTLVVAVAIPLSRACVYSHLNGDLYEVATNSPCAELDTLTTLVFDLFIDELHSTSFAESQCKWLVVMCLEYCNELLNEYSAVQTSIQLQNANANVASQSNSTRGCLARLLPLLCSASARIGVAELTSTVYYSLVELLAHPVSSQFAREIDEHIVAVAISTHSIKQQSYDNGYLSLAEEMFIATFSRSLGLNEPSGNFNTVLQSTFSVLVGVCHGLNLLAKYYLEGGESLAIARLRQKLVKLFEHIATDMYSERRSDAPGARERGACLGLLLAPLATSFSLSSSTQKLQEQESTSTLRSFWYALVVFRLWERESWNLFPDWLTSYQAIAATSPPLILSLDNSSTRYLLKEQSSSELLKGMSAATRTSLAAVWSKVAHFPVWGLDFSQTMYGVTCQYLESLRVGGSLDIRSIFTYMMTEGIESNSWLRKTFTGLADHVFSVWIEASSAQLRGTVDSSAPSWRIRSVVEQIFEFLVGHCAHRNSLIRTTSLRFARRTLARIKWLRSTPTANFVLLDTVQALSEQARINSQRESTFTSDLDDVATTHDSGSNSNAQKPHSLPSVDFVIDPNESDATRIRRAVLPTSNLPQDAVSLASATKDMHAFATDWLTESCKTVPGDLVVILHEYSLFDYVKDATAHVGVSLVSSLMSTSLTSPPTSPASYSDTLKLKSQYIAEILGMLQAECGGGDNVKKISWKESWSRPLSCFVSSAEKLGTSLSTQADLDAGVDILPALWRCIALIHKMSAVLLQSSPSHKDATAHSSAKHEAETQEMWDAVHRLIHLVSSCAFRHFSKSIVEELVIGWHWLFLSYPRLRNRIIYESLLMLRWSCEERVGMFSTKNDVDNMSAHELWIAFHDKNITTFGDHDGVAFCFLEAILFACPTHVVKFDPAFLTPRFRLLSFAFKTLTAATETARGPSIHRRRAMRERIIFCALDWFDAAALTPIDLTSARESHAVLAEFLSELRADAQQWQEYDDSTDENSATEQRAAGHDAAVGFLRLSTGQIDDDDFTHLGELTTFEVAEMVSSQRSLGIPSLSSDSSTLKLLQMLLLHEMDRLASWLGLDVGTDNEQKVFRSRVRMVKSELAAISTIKIYKNAIKAAWCISPDLAFVLASRFPKLEARDGLKKGLSHLELFLVSGSAGAHGNWQAAPIIVGCINKLTLAASPEKLQSLRDVGYDLNELKMSCLSKLACWCEAPIHVALDMLNRLHGRSDDALFEKQQVSVEVMRYALRCIAAAKTEVLVFYAPQLVQLLRRDEGGAIADFIKELCGKSALILHTIMWNLLLEAAPTMAEANIQSHGYCKKLQGPDTLPARAHALISQIRLSQSTLSLDYLDKQIDFFSQVTSVSALLRGEPDKSKHSAMIEQALKELHLTPGLYMPTDPGKRVVGLEVRSGQPMQSAARCPFMLSFTTEWWRGPDEYKALRVEGALNSKPQEPSLETQTVPSLLSSPGLTKRGKTRRLELNHNSGVPSPDWRGGKPPRSSVSSNSPPSSSSGRSQAIFKVHDDIRQDALTIQVACILRDEFAAVGLPLYIEPYSVIPNRTGDGALGGIIQVVPDVRSRHQIGKQGGKRLIEYYQTQFGAAGSPGFKQAQVSFASSLAAYAVLCHLLSIKDRHNGNILHDKAGRLIHIDYGFLLGISPGGNLGFENAPFKLTGEMVELLGGQGSELYQSFFLLTVRGFLAARHVMEPILAAVASFADSGLPCFLHRADNLKALRSRFAPELTDTEAASYMSRLIKASKRSLSTTLYDGVQKAQQGTFSPSWS